MFENRCDKLERIDTGDYIDDEYRRFLREIKFINRFLGDSRALRKTLFREIERRGLKQFSVLDVGAGSGELLSEIVTFANKSGRKANVIGLDLNAISTEAISCAGIPAVRGDALKLPFADASFDFAICSLFTHHLPDETVVSAVGEMSRVASLGIYVIDLHRHPAAYSLFRLFCFAFRISPLVREDGLLSILRSFRPEELAKLGERAGLRKPKVRRVFPFRIALEGA